MNNPGGSPHYPNPSQQPDSFYGGAQQQFPPGYRDHGGYGASQYSNSMVGGPYAGWAARVGATVLDGLIIGIPAGILFGLAYATGFDSGDSYLVAKVDGTFERTTVGGGIDGVGITLMAVAVLVALAGSVLLIYREGATGQTPGKALLGIRLISESTGQPLGFGAALGRKFCHVVDSSACYIGFLFPLWDAKRQTLADKITSSVVVRT
ncbi:RDD family protein [Nocardia sp. NPDC048505]|uniref:RDD family protein n=1 Tax=Nocardia sp. NPDC048505 TaxID=3155756 RepID=UPI0033EF445A